MSGKFPPKAVASHGRSYHYRQAEALLEIGRNVIDELANYADMRSKLPEDAPDKLYDHVTMRMDEKGKQAMGIWAQAQVHATLAASNVGR